MGDKVTKLIFRSVFTKTERNYDYVPQKPSPEASICLDCGNKKCKGNCKRYKEEYRKLKEKQQ